MYVTSICAACSCTLSLLFSSRASAKSFAVRAFGCDACFKAEAVGVFSIAAGNGGSCEDGDAGEFANAEASGSTTALSVMGLELLWLDLAGVPGGVVQPAGAVDLRTESFSAERGALGPHEAHAEGLRPAVPAWGDPARGWVLPRAGAGRGRLQGLVPSLTLPGPLAGLVPWGEEERLAARLLPRLPLASLRVGAWALPCPLSRCEWMTKCSG